MNGINVADIFAYLSAWFARRCPGDTYGLLEFEEFIPEIIDELTD